MKLFIVTGGSKGVGFELSKKLVRKGHKVAVISRSSNSELDSNSEISYFKADLSNLECISPVIDSLFSRFDLSQFDEVGLINNAGAVLPIGKVENLEMDKIILGINLNLTASIALSSLFLEKLSQYNGVKTIFNISSGVAKRPIASWSVYSAAKAGLENFSQCLVKEYGSNLRVFNFSPGVIDTNMQETIRAQSSADFPEVDRFQALKEEGNLRTPEQVASVICDILLGKLKTQEAFLSISDFD